jgi:hypothetical protein
MTLVQVIRLEEEADVLGYMSTCIIARDEKSLFSLRLRSLGFPALFVNPNNLWEMRKLAYFIREGCMESRMFGGISDFN